MKQFLFTYCLVLMVGMAVAQPKQKSPVKQAVPELKKLLNGTDLPFNVINDSIAVIPYRGENISSYQVIVQKISDLYIVFVNLTEALPGKIDEKKYKYLLQQNDNYDVVKIGMSEDDNTVYLRADVYKVATTTALLKRIIVQVANVANIIGGDLK